MKIDISNELSFRTARSGGKGGQNVNKVETMVEGRWAILGSSLIDNKQKKQIKEKLASRITKDGYLLVKSQTERTQLGNKSLVVKRINELVNQALVRKIPRIATQPSTSVKKERLKNKKYKAKLKEGRQKWQWE